MAADRCHSLPVKVMAHSHSLSANERVVDPMIALARCTPQDCIVVAGSRAIEIMSMLQRRGYLRAAASANCGRAARQYNIALLDWRQRSLRTLDPALAWIAGYLMPTGLLVVWVDPLKPAVSDDLLAMLQRHGFDLEAGATYDYGYAVSARRHAANPMSKAA